MQSVVINARLVKNSAISFPPKDWKRMGRNAYLSIFSRQAWRSEVGLSWVVIVLAMVADVASGGVGAVAQETSLAVSTVAAGFRTLEGEHLTLITDLPSSPEVDELPGVFDQAMGQWCEFFGLPRQSLDGWHLRGFLMGERERFRQAGWLPDSLPPFPHGFQRGDQLWVVEQPSDYYRRHMLLHEGTHAFMARWLGGTGPPWYMEGMAELLATHRYDEGRLTLGVMPASKEEVPEWGRILLVRQAVAAGKARTLDQVLALPPRQFRDVDAYAWSWAAATLLNGHPQWHERFRRLPARAAWDPARFHRQWSLDLQPDRAALEEAWQLLIHQLDYGYDVAEEQVIERRARPWRQRATAQVDSRQGWQSTGLRLESGRRYQISARGRYQLNQQTPTWFSEAGGITIRYHQGRPLGMLLAAVRPDAGPLRSTALLEPRPLGLQVEWVPERSGELFLRINEPAGQLGDNQGSLQVEVQALSNGAEGTAAAAPPD
jgi:hypothetical protein